MKQIGSILLKGLVTILPIGLTIYFVYWMGVTTESLLSKPIKLAVGEGLYFPGMGLITGFVLLFLVGLAVNAFLVRRMLGFGEELLLRVPVVKTVYSAIRDMTRLVNTEKKKGDLDRVVTLDFGFGPEKYLVGVLEEAKGRDDIEDVLTPDSPLGQALVGKQPGDVSYEANGREMTVKILEIS